MVVTTAILRDSGIFKNGHDRKETKGLTLHSVGCAQPNANVFIKLWNTPDTYVAPHAIIDANSGNVYQTLPWGLRAAHVGGSANNTHIGVEMAEPACIKYVRGSVFTCSDFGAAQAAAMTTYKSAVSLFASLCKEYSLDPLEPGVIVSHSEAYKLGIGSNHADPEHLWMQLDLPYTMDGFRAAVNEIVNPKKDLNQIYRVRTSWSDASGQIGAFMSLALAKKCADANPGYFVYGTNGKKLYPETSTAKKTFVVQVLVKDLMIRTGPGTNYDWNGKYTDKGCFTIVDTQNGTGSQEGWGLLAAYETKRNGWISLDYTTRL